VTAKSAGRRSRPRDAARTREDILDAAEKLFAADGYEATSLEMIGREAGYSRGTPSYIFGSKNELYHAVFERAFERLQGRTNDAFARAEGTESLEAAIDAIIGAYLEIPQQFAKLIEREVLRGGEVLAEVNARMTSIHDNYAHLEEMTQRHFPGVDARNLYVSIVALGWFPITQATAMLGALGIDANTPAFVADYRRFVTTMLLDGLRDADREGRGK
jgi:TetR/AcrR family transcriptional regulator